MCQKLPTNQTSYELLEQKSQNTLWKVTEASVAFPTRVTAGMSVGEMARKKSDGRWPRGHGLGQQECRSLERSSKGVHEGNCSKPQWVVGGRVEEELRNG